MQHRPESTRQSPEGVENLRDPTFAELDRLIAEEKQYGQSPAQRRQPLSGRVATWGLKYYWRRRPCFVCSEARGYPVFGHCAHRELLVARVLRAQNVPDPGLRTRPFRVAPVRVPDNIDRRAIYLYENGRDEEAEAFLREHQRETLHTRRM